MQGKQEHHRSALRLHPSFNQSSSSSIHPTILLRQTLVLPCELQAAQSVTRDSPLALLRLDMQNARDAERKSNTGSLAMSSASKPGAACVPCFKRKMRCDRQTPCANCRRRRDQSEKCHYPTASSSDSVAELTQRLEKLEEYVRATGADPDEVARGKFTLPQLPVPSGQAETTPVPRVKAVDRSRSTWYVRPISVIGCCVKLMPARPKGQADTRGQQQYRTVYRPLKAMKTLSKTLCQT